MTIKDKLANGLFLGPSNISGGGIGLFSGYSQPKGVPICEYKGDVYDTKKEVLERYKYTIKIGFKHPVLLYSVYHQFSKKIIDCHPSFCKKEMGLGGFINDARNHNERLPYGTIDYLNLFLKKSTGDEALRSKIIKGGYNVTFWHVPNETNTYLVPIREIQPGEEIYVDYGDEYWQPFAEIEKENASD